MRTRFAIFSVVLTTAACDEAHRPTPTDRTAATLVADLADEAPQAGPSELEAARRQARGDVDPQTLEPRRTRAGFLRFTTSAIHDPAFAAVFLERLAARRDSAEVRAALVEALPRTGGDWAEELVEMLPDERDASVRVAMMAAFRRAPSTAAQVGIVAGLDDVTAEVRAEAARVAGARPELTGTVELLTSRTNDRDAQVRAAAIRSLGLLGATAHVATIDAGLRDGDPQVRLEAIRAIRRLDPDGASRRVASLVEDEHEIVRNAALRLAR